MESLVSRECLTRFSGLRVLITGHTGFKGAWLACLLSAIGAQVYGVSLDEPDRRSHLDVLTPSPLSGEYFVDIRDQKALEDVLQEVEPEAIFHLAAQALVLRSYDEPVETWGVNVIGSLVLLEAIRNVGFPNLRCVLMVTSDKVYENNGDPWAFREVDRLGGSDLYSSSKAAMELLINSYRESFPGFPPIISVRAGNVHGGGDWSENRLIPDIVRGLDAGNMIVRNIHSTRPWQHVLDPLFGYIVVSANILSGRSLALRSLNFGPNWVDSYSVGDVVDFAKMYFGDRLKVSVVPDKAGRESKTLSVDSSLAKGELGWTPGLGFREGLTLTFDWYKNFELNHSANTMEQIKYFLRLKGVVDGDG